MSRRQWAPPPNHVPLHPSQYPTTFATSDGESSLSAGPDARPRRQYRNDYETFLMSLDGPVSGFHPTTDEELAERFRQQGVAKKDIPQAIMAHDHRANEMMRECGGTLPMIGCKPKDSNFQVFVVPDTRIAIRIWDGGMESFGQYLIDFFDLDSQKAVAPRGWSIHPMQSPGMMPMAGPLVSWAQSFGAPSTNIPSGADQFCVPEGSYLRLVREGVPPVPDFCFAVPVRTVATGSFATPVVFRPGYT